MAFASVALFVPRHDAATANPEVASTFIGECPAMADFVQTMTKCAEERRHQKKRKLCDALFCRCCSLNPTGTGPANRVRGRGRKGRKDSVIVLPPYLALMLNSLFF
ncbi:hypothetical protein TW95_gp0953 [Pandoravirus inopinatum]|uniref:Uncharacterized protein n=1 Tax=Pandoravirus inopinatum TaxID=1605721 RepID=A0A0B5JDD8_9VIRU|nr:hypothetical protein TW95_gp0953 [Pandoravirus inopinatum]AJF97687.1 hypothetical protein [Pandoravirus inopinatum]